MTYAITVTTNSSVECSSDSFGHLLESVGEAVHSSWIRWGGWWGTLRSSCQRSKVHVFNVGVRWSWAGVCWHCQGNASSTCCFRTPFPVSDNVDQLVEKIYYLEKSFPVCRRSFRYLFNCIHPNKDPWLLKGAVFWPQGASLRSWCPLFLSFRGWSSGLFTLSLLCAPRQCLSSVKMFRSLCHAQPGLVWPVDRLLQRRTIKWRFSDGSLAVWLSSMVQTDWVMVWTLFDETLNSGFPINRRKTTATESNVGVGGWSLQPSSPFWRASRLLECLSVLEEVKWANLPVDTGCEIPFFSCVLPLSGNTGWQEEEGFLVVLLTSYLRCCSPFWQTGWKSSGRKVCFERKVASHSRLLQLLLWI